MGGKKSVFCGLNSVFAGDKSHYLMFSARTEFLTHSRSFLVLENLPMDTCSI